MTTQPPEAVKLASEYRETMPADVLHLWARDAVDEMRRLHEEAVDLRVLSSSLLNKNGGLQLAVWTVQNANSALQARVQEREAERDRFRDAHREWSDKTDWVQESSQAHELGKHRADVLRERIVRVQRELDAALGEPTQEFEKWLATYSTLSAARDVNGYADLTTEMLWHAWQAAAKTKAPEGASAEWIDANARPGLALTNYTCAHDFSVQPSSGIRLCQKCGISETAARKAAPQQEAQEPVAWQSRTRPTWGTNTSPWSPWEPCTKGQAEDYWKTPLLHDWAYEARALYTASAAPTYQQVIAAWNAQADETNQWDELGEDEKIEWALQCRDQIRGVTKMMRDDDAASAAVAQAAGDAA